MRAQPSIAVGKNAIWATSTINAGMLRFISLYCSFVGGIDQFRRKPSLVQQCNEYQTRWRELVTRRRIPAAALNREQQPRLYSQKRAALQMRFEEPQYRIDGRYAPTGSLYRPIVISVIG